jgi:predicted phosphoribosyltransferase
MIVLNEDVVAGLGLEAEIIRRVAEREGRELARREQLYREGRPMADPAGRTTIVVDDGLATGSSMRAASGSGLHVRGARARGGSRVTGVASTGRG